MHFCVTAPLVISGLRQRVRANARLDDRLRVGPGIHFIMGAAFGIAASHPNVTQLPNVRLPKIERNLMTSSLRSDSLQQNKNRTAKITREEWHARADGCSTCFGDGKRWRTTGRRHGGGCRICRPLSSASPAQGRIYGGGARLGGRRWRNLVLEQVSRRALRH